MITKVKLDKNTLISSVATLMTVLFWISFDIYRALTKTTITKVTQQQMEPLNPKIKREVIQQLKSNLSFSEEELNISPIILKKETASPKETEKSPAATEAAYLEEETLSP